MRIVATIFSEGLPPQKVSVVQSIHSSQRNEFYTNASTFNIAHIFSKVLAKVLVK